MRSASVGDFTVAVYTDPMNSSGIKFGLKKILKPFPFLTMHIS